MVITWFHVSLYVTFFLLAKLSIATATGENKISADVKDVIIGGAGVSGVALARTLHVHGITNFEILEANNYVGGRMSSKKFGRKEGSNKKWRVERGSNYISGGINNPFWYTKTMFVNDLRGYEMWWNMTTFTRKGKEVYGNWEDDWDYNNTEGEMTAAQRFTYAYDYGELLALECLQGDKEEELDEETQDFCNQLCEINITKQTGFGIKDLVDTNHTICNENDVFILDDTVDMSMTDLLRASGFDARNENDVSICTARVIERILFDAELSKEPWKASAKYSMSGGTFSGDFGDEMDFVIFDNRGYRFLLHIKASEFLETRKKNSKKIVITDERVGLGKKITKIYWSPNGNQDATVTYCLTKHHKKGNNKGFCLGTDRFNMTAKNFVSTFSVGVLKQSLKLERHGTSFEDSENIAPRFFPPLSTIPQLMYVIDDFEMGPFGKIFLQFKHKFWDDDKEIFLTPYSTDSSQGNFQCDFASPWYSLDNDSALPDSKILLMYATGRRAKYLSKHKSRTEVLRQTLPVLNIMFKDGIKEALKKEGRDVLEDYDVIDVLVADWYGDPLVRGAWNTLKVGLNTTAFYNYLESGPRFGNLMFSGEGTCERHSGWVHGAWFSGERSGKILLKERFSFEEIDTRTLCDVSVDEMEYVNGVWRGNPNVPSSLIDE